MAPSCVQRFFSCICRGWSDVKFDTECEVRWSRVDTGEHTCGIWVVPLAQHVISRSSLLSCLFLKYFALFLTRSEADAEQVVQDKTAAVDLFVREEAVLRITVAAKKDYGDDDDDAQNNANGEAMTGVSQIDQGHLNKVITEVGQAGGQDWPQ